MRLGRAPDGQHLAELEEGRPQALQVAHRVAREPVLLLPPAARAPPRPPAASARALRAPARTTRTIQQTPLVLLRLQPPAHHRGRQPRQPGHCAHPHAQRVRFSKPPWSCSCLQPPAHHRGRQPRQPGHCAHPHAQRVRFSKPPWSCSASSRPRTTAAASRASQGTARTRTHNAYDSANPLGPAPAPAARAPPRPPAASARALRAPACTTRTIQQTPLVLLRLQPPKHHRGRQPRQPGHCAAPCDAVCNILLDECAAPNHDTGASPVDEARQAELQRCALHSLSGACMYDDRLLGRCSDVGVASVISRWASLKVVRSGRACT